MRTPWGRPNPVLAITGAAIVFGLLILVLLPSTLFVLDDDFGYLRSILGTLRHHRPWTHDFLEPWSIAHSVFAAGVYRLTESFFLATYGLHAVYAACGYAAVAALLRSRGFSITLTLVIAFGLMTLPVLLWRALEFTGMALYVPCLLWAIWAAENRRWLVFGLIWLCAVSTRQSAIAWLAWPAVECIQAFARARGGETRDWLSPAVVVAGGFAIFLGLITNINPTQALQLSLLQETSGAKLAASLTTFGIGLFLIFAGAGLAAILQVFHAAPRPRPAAGISRWAILAVGIGALALDFRSGLTVDRIPVHDTTGTLYLKLLVLLALAGWLFFRPGLRLAPVLGGIASVALLSFRGMAWDYYFLDAAAFGLFAASIAPEMPGAPGVDLRWRRRGRIAVAAALGLALVFHALTAHRLRVQMDEAVARCVLYEKALRAGRLTPLELHGATFGFKGWHLHDYGRSREANRRWLSESLFPRPETVVLERVRLGLAAPPDRAPATETIAEETFPIGWIWQFRYRLQRTGPSPTSPPGLPLEVFPLDNREWQALIRAPR